MRRNMYGCIPFKDWTGFCFTCPETISSSVENGTLEAKTQRTMRALGTHREFCALVTFGTTETYTEEEPK